MEVLLEQALEAPTSVVWPFLVEASRLNRWSTATVSQLEAGDRGVPGGVGELRRVELPKVLGLGPTLDEVIVAADPGARLVYRALPHGALRAHRGEVTLRPHEGGCALRWHVRASLAVGALERATARYLEAELAASLRALAREVRGVSPEDAALELPAPFEFADDEQVASATRYASLAVGAAQARANDLAAQGNPFALAPRAAAAFATAWFEAGGGPDIEHRAFARRVAARIAERALENLARVTHLEPVEPAWRRVFAELGRARDERATSPHPSRLEREGLLSAMAAIVEHELPSALADVYVDAYGERADFVRFRADFQWVDRATPRVVRSLLSQLLGAPAGSPPWVRVSSEAIIAAHTQLLLRRLSDFRERFRRAEHLAHQRLTAWPARGGEEGAAGGDDGPRSPGAGAS